MRFLDISHFLNNSFWSSVTSVISVGKSVISVSYIRSVVLGWVSFVICTDLKELVKCT